MADHPTPTLRRMDRKHRPNPYIDLNSADMYRACQHRAGELMEPSGPRTREERAELALDTAYLLLAVAKYVDTSEHIPETPHQAMRDPRVGVAEAFGKYHDQLARTARYQVLIQAMEMAAGGGVMAPAGSFGMSGDIYNRALASDDGLREVLAQLDEKYRARVAKPQHPGK